MGRSMPSGVLVFPCSTRSLARYLDDSVAHQTTDLKTQWDETVDLPRSELSDLVRSFRVNSSGWVLTTHKMMVLCNHMDHVYEKIRDRVLCSCFMVPYFILQLPGSYWDDVYYSPGVNQPLVDPARKWQKRERDLLLWSFGYFTGSGNISHTDNGDPDA